jgi:hypothetical protein
MHVATNPERYSGRVVGNGSCALFVQRVSRVGLTRNWRQGRRVRNGNVAANTIIATFVGNPPRYANRSNGTAHAAILISEQPGGLRVWDQWRGQPVHQRTIAFRAGQGRPVNDGDAYFVVMT